MTKLDIQDFVEEMSRALKAIELLSDESIDPYNKEKLDAIDFARKASLRHANEILSLFKDAVATLEIED